MEEWSKKNIFEIRTFNLFLPYLFKIITQIKLIKIQHTLVYDFKGNEY